MRPKNLEKEAAIRRLALQIIAEEGLENLTMQKLAKAANISPRTIYIKYENKEDLLIKLFIEEVLENYERAVLEGFDDQMNFATGVRKIYTNTFRYLKANKPAFALIQYGKSSPLLNKAFQERGIAQGRFFAPIHRFIRRQIAADHIISLPFDVYRAMLFSPIIDLVSEYFDYRERPRQIITEKTVLACSEVLIRGFLK